MLEDKYYLGNKVDYLMSGGGKRYDTFLLAKAYETYGFYQLNKVYCTGLIGDNIISKLYTKYYICHASFDFAEKSHLILQKNKTRL